MKRMDDMEDQLTQRIDSMDEEFKERIDHIDEEFSERIDHMEDEFQRFSSEISSSAVKRQKTVKTKASVPLIVRVCYKYLIILYCGINVKIGLVPFGRQSVTT